MSDEITGGSADANGAASVGPGAAPDADAGVLEHAEPAEGTGPADGVEIAVTVEDAILPEPDDLAAAEIVEGVEPAAEEGAAPAEGAAAEAEGAAAEAGAARAEGAAEEGAAPAEEGAAPEGAAGAPAAEVVDVSGSAESETSLAPVKPARTKTEGKADGSGVKAERKADGSKSHKKAKKKSGKAKSEGIEAEGHVKTTPNTTPPSPAANEEAPAPGDTEKPAGDGRVRRILIDNILAVILGVVAVGLAVALALTMLQVSDKNAVGSARASALVAARTYSVELAGYNYQHLDQDFSIVLSHSTPSFRRSFSQSSDALKSTLVKYHASAQATVVAAGLISATTSRAVVLVLLNQTVSNSTQKQPTTDRSQVEITLVRTGGTWLIDQVMLL